MQKYIDEHKVDDLRKIILKNKELFGIPTGVLLAQIATKRKAKEKLPLYHSTKGMIYPPPENLEQSSSQATALYKSELIKKLRDHSEFTGVDLTGGYGVDTFFISRAVQRMHYVEPDPFLLELANYSHQLLGATNIEYHQNTAGEFLNIPGKFDFMFVDPSRKTNLKKKVYGLEDSQPNISELIHQIFARTTRLIIKASPLFDIQAGIAKIPFVSEVHVISVQNECKELLFVSEINTEGTPSIKAVNIVQGGEAQELSFDFPEEQGRVITFSEPLQYLFEPNAAILKAGAFKTVAARFQLQKIHPNTHLYTAARPVDSFPGRKFEIEALVRLDAREIKRYFPDGKANVTTRNYPLNPEALKKKTGLKDGGEKYLIGFSGHKKKFLAVARRS